MKVILASQSPRRKELMDLFKIPYEVIVSNSQEQVDRDLPIEEQSKRISWEKANLVFQKTTQMKDRVIIACDTMCVLEGKSYGKPKNKDQAIQYFKEFSGKTQEVISSLTILVETKGTLEMFQDLEKTKVTFRAMTKEEILSCLEKEDVYDKAGGYHILSYSGIFIEKIEGNLMNVIGIPMEKVYKVLKQYHLIS